MLIPTNGKDIMTNQVNHFYLIAKLYLRIDQLLQLPKAGRDIFSLPVETGIYKTFRTNHELTTPTNSPSYRGKNHGEGFVHFLSWMSPAHCGARRMSPEQASTDIGVEHQGLTMSLIILMHVQDQIRLWLDLFGQIWSFVRNSLSHRI